MTRVLLTGGAGLLGHDLLASAPVGAVVVAPGSRELDITDAAAVEGFVARSMPDVLVNAAAYTNVDGAESDAARAHAVNGIGPAILAAAAARHGIRVVHFSSDYVFPGDAARPYREQDATGPVNVYGRTKLAGERAVMESGAYALVIRTAWLYGAHGRSFPLTMHRRVVSGLHTRVVDDQVGRPTHTRDLAAATWRLIAAGADGVLHVSSSGDPVSWYGVARNIFAAHGALHLLEPCASSEYPLPAPRPRYSVLDTARADALIGPLRPWPDALEEFRAQVDRMRADA